MRIKKYIDFISESKIIKMEMPLPSDITQIADAFIKAGKDIFVVGGAIRDFLQGKDPKDYDLVTNALPEESKKILHGFNVSDEQGKNFGVLRVYTKDEPLGYELASYRKDISKGRDTKGDDEKVELGSHITIEDDCNRRDLTINSLFYDIKKGEIVDICGGVDDIKNGVIRAVGDPTQRFLEDRLRILRVFRFAARVEGKIDITTSNAIKVDNRLRGIGPKDDVAQERIWEEFGKAFKQCKDFTYYLNLLSEYDMWNQMFPNSHINTKFITNHNLIIVLANLFKLENTNGLERKMVQNWKIESTTAVKVIFLINLLNLDINNWIDLYKSKIRCNIDKNTILEWYRVNNINQRIFNSFVDYKPFVSAEYLKLQGWNEGPELGKEIRRLEMEKIREMI